MMVVSLWCGVIATEEEASWAFRGLLERRGDFAFARFWPGGVVVESEGSTSGS
jgi:hypothetical protein